MPCPGPNASSLFAYLAGIDPLQGYSNISRAFPHRDPHDVRYIPLQQDTGHSVLPERGTGGSILDGADLLRTTSQSASPTSASAE